MQKKNKCKSIYLFTVMLLFGLIFFMWNSIAVYADEPIIIVIDPGHGGENLGAEYESYTEKDMTLIMAKAMKEELEKYKNVEVYLTRDSDMDMSIKDRAAFAAEKNADFLFCLHFNMSVKHDLFGAEVWIPSTGSLYARGYSFAQIEMQAFSDLGLYSRGIKTKLNNRNEDYYGILRYCTQNQVPAALIEHCHLDEKRDQVFYQKGEEQLKAFGVLDATSVAKYFRLSSDELSVDYSDYAVPECLTPEKQVKPDETEPEKCEITVTGLDTETGRITVHMEATDSDSYILYYNYSLDGGNTYMQLMEWPRPNAWNQSSEAYDFEIQLPYDCDIELRCNAYNSFDVWKESNIISIDAIENPQSRKQREDEEKKAQYEELTIEKVAVPEEKNTEPVLILSIVLLILVVIFVFTYLLVKSIRRLLKGKKQR